MDRVGRVNTGDGQFSIWNVAWVAHALIADPRHLYDANIFYPHPNTLAWSEANLGAGILAMPAWWATRNPYLAHNSAATLGFLLSFAGAYLLVRHVTGHRGAAAFAGIAFAFCPFIYARMAHIQLLMTFGLPWSPVGAAPADRRDDRRPRGRAWACARRAGPVVRLLRHLRRPVGRARRAVLRTEPRALATPPLLGHSGWRPPSPRWCSCRSSCRTSRVEGADFSRALADAAEYSADWRSYLASADLGASLDAAPAWPME